MEQIHGLPSRAIADELAVSERLSSGVEPSTSGADLESIGSFISDYEVFVDIPSQTRIIRIYSFVRPGFPGMPSTGATGCAAGDTLVRTAALR
ncbi:hypothetical protein [Burkholderia cepacia]|uniref:hypothetical protein n=1 Tax=Burkholderia cepacia TaxID=292 RepID=UPI000A42248B|nr:hypothetical protein [Burkholderia cepacia]